MSWTIDWAERGRVPDGLLRWAIRRMLKSRLRREQQPDAVQQQQTFMEFVEKLRQSPIALHTAAANEQHYQVPTAFFLKTLGPRLKYSCCWWDETTRTLAEAEEAMLRRTAERAELADGQSILELGCGWGSLTLWMAEHYPHARITAVSNSHTQREYIQTQATQRGLANVTVRTCDMNDFATEQAFDRVVSVEMFEHMRNYERLMQRIAGWLKPTGKLFVHIFAHREYAYPFETDGQGDWMAKHFFTGGIMPSDHLLAYFQNDLRLRQHWRVNGVHYARTLDAWLAQIDTHRAELEVLFANAPEANKQVQRWRMFMMACSELFGYAHGNEWWVSHYLFER